MAYVSDHRKWFGMGFPKKKILIDYVSRSCDPPKMKIGGGVDAYVSRSCDLPKKETFDGLRKHFPKNDQKRKFDGLHKQIM